MSRKLARIEKILKVEKHPNADLLDIATIGGWRSVVGKDSFKEGDLCIYFEVDSLLPLTPQFEFLARGSKPKKTIIGDGKEVTGYRLKTTRLREELSQGLILPIASFQETLKDLLLEPGLDLTNLLSVYKYDPPIPAELAGSIEGSFPGFLIKTDEERIQNLLFYLEKYRGERFYATRKMDGTSSTYYKSEDKLGVCGRTFQFKEDTRNVFWNIANRYDLKNTLPEGYAIQAETAGEGIQGNRGKLKGVDSYVFYVYDIAKGEYLPLDEMVPFVAKLGMKTVPLVNDNFILNHTCEELLVLADIFDNPALPQEGLVFRLYNSRQKISFKAISNEYLLKYGG